MRQYQISHTYLLTTKLEFFAPKIKYIKMIKYILKPAKKLGVNPQTMEVITAITDPRTDIIPLTPYIHGIYLTKLFCFNICIPVGKGIPSKKPKGNNKIKQTIARRTNP